MNSVKKFRIIKFKSKPILAAKSISKSFDARVVLRKIDIHLNQGEMLGLLGSNGAGKSTFMNIIQATALSGGERRRTEIARCLISNPKILLLDEPFAGVDLLSIQDLKGLLIKLQSRGCAVLITDHNASQLLSVVDRAYVIANGTIVANGTPRQIVNTAEAKKLYFGEDFNI